MTERKRRNVLASLIIGMAFCLGPQAQAEPPKLSCDGLRRAQLMREVGLMIIDVRPPDDFIKLHIQGAKNVPSQVVQTSQLPRTGRLVLYCDENGCPLSQRAVESLISDGYTNVSFLDGGLAAWLAKGYPVAKGSLKLRSKTGKVRSREAEKKLVAGAWAIDVRTPEEYKAGHLPNAKNFPLETLDADLVRLPKDVELIVYDRTAARAGQAVQKLTAAGLKATELNGGLAAWVKRRKPLETK